MFEDSTWKGFNLGEANGLPAEGFPSDRRGFHAGADGKETHGDLWGVGLSCHRLWLGDKRLLLAGGVDGFDFFDGFIGATAPAAFASCNGW